MQFGRIILSPSLLVGAVGCWLLAPMPAAGIVGGASIADPAIARPVVLVLSTEAMCSGVAIAPDLVLTAAHCVPAGYQYAVLAPLESDHKYASPSQIITNRFYSTAPLQTPELALLKLRVEITSHPARLSGKDAAWSADRYIVVGFGRTAPDAKIAPDPVAHEATLVPVFRLLGAGLLRMVDPATKGKGAGLGTCNGDSGGAVFEKTGGSPALVGIITSGDCVSFSQAQLIAPQLQWILDTATSLGSLILR
jgi:Trypsin